ncbi:MAG: hypothetical protein HUU50_01700, partial [Candidatus Brocadiae bacterium]|nr:hypothetical protein [Candidatus Brocadiia bacterium]
EMQKRFQARKPWMAKKQAPRFHKQEMQKRFEWKEKQAPKFHKPEMNGDCQECDPKVQKDMKKQDMPKKHSRCYRPRMQQEEK